MNGASHGVKKIVGELNLKPSFKLPVLLSAMLGSVIAIIVDLAVKESGPSFVTIKQILVDNLTTNPGVAFILAALLLLIIAGGLSQIFDVKTKLAGLYLGISILSVIFTAVPKAELDPVPVTHDSERIVLLLSGEEQESLDQAIVTIYDVRTRETVARSKMGIADFDTGNLLQPLESELQRTRTQAAIEDIRNALSPTITSEPGVLEFYLDAGQYEVRIEAPGYWIATCTVEVDDDPDTPVVMGVSLEETAWPVFLQRAFK